MRNLNISASEVELTKFGIKGESLTFSEFVEIVSRELTKQSLEKCIQLSENYGLSKLTMDEITKEVKAVRRNAKGRN